MEGQQGGNEQQQEQKGNDHPPDTTMVVFPIHWIRIYNNAIRKLRTTKAARTNVRKGIKSASEPGFSILDTKKKRAVFDGRCWRPLHHTSSTIVAWHSGPGFYCKSTSIQRKTDDRETYH